MATSKTKKQSSVTSHKGSDKILDYPCTICKESELNKKALYFCGQCVKLFCLKCGNAHNQLNRKHKLLGEKDISKWKDPRQSVKGDPCTLHAGNLIQMYCGHHNAVCCKVCLTKNHRSCKAVQPIKDVAKGILQSSELKNLPPAIKSNQEKVSKRKKKKQQDRQTLDEKCDNIIKSVKDIRKRIDRKTAELEKKTIDDVEKFRSTIQASLKADEEALNRTELYLQRLMKDLQGKAKKYETSAFICVKNCQSKIAETEKLLKSISEEPVLFGYTLNTELEKNLSSLQSFGSFESSSQRSNASKLATGGQNVSSGTTPKKQAKKGYRAENIKSYNLRIRNDSESCGISGICSLPNGNILAVDYSDERVKQLSGKFHVVAHMDFPSGVWDICHLGDYKAAVTADEGIHFLDARNNQIRLIKKVECNHPCYGIACNNDLLYVTSLKALYIYKTSGQLVKQLFEDTALGKLTVYKVAVAGNGKKIYVTNSDKNLLVTLDNKGKLLSTFTDPDLLQPEAVCVAENGSVFVSGVGSHTILHVNSEGTKKLATVAKQGDGVKKALSLLFHETASQLIVGQLSEEKGLLVMNLSTKSK